MNSSSYSTSTTLECFDCDSHISKSYKGTWVQSENICVRCDVNDPTFREIASRYPNIAIRYTSDYVMYVEVRRETVVEASYFVEKQGGGNCTTSYVTKTTEQAFVSFRR